jgi:hypothetical protein
MKTNNAVANGGYLCGVSGETCSFGSWIHAYANYLTQYVRDYESSGISISHIGFLKSLMRLSRTTACSPTGLKQLR